MEEQNQRHKGFYESLNGKHVRIKLQSGEDLQGVICSNNYNIYDIELETKDGASYLIPKNRVMFVLFSGGVR